MIADDDVTRLLDINAPGAGVVSVYLSVPLDPSQRRGMPARLEDLLAQGEHTSLDSQASARARRAELPALRREVGAHANEWLGHSVAIFSSRNLGLLETIPLRSRVPERAVIGSRPYVRPLLAELQRCPSYTVAVVDRRHAWLFRVSADGMDTAKHVQGQTVGSRRFGGWYGLESYRNDQRTRKLAKEHYAATVSALADTAEDCAHCGPIVVGGHEAEISGFLGVLPPALRGRVVGTFVIDPHTMTSARVRQLADPVVAGWAAEQERRLATELAGQRPGDMAVFGLDACVQAANDHAIELLVVPGDEMRPGLRCDDCDALAVRPGPCPVCTGRTHPVPDVIEELAVKVTRDAGSVWSVRDSGILADVAARRRFPPPA